MWPGAWHDGAAQDRLTGVVPDWLVAAVRTQHAPVPWADMVRAAFAICLPLAAGIAAGDRSLAQLVALGGLLGVVVDAGGPFLARLERVGSAALGGAAGLVIGYMIHGRGWWSVLALVVVAGVAAMMSAVGAIGSVTALQLLTYTAICLGPLGALRPLWHTALGFLLGTLWALLLIVPGWLLSPRAAEQRSVAAVYRTLGGQLRGCGTAFAAESRRKVTEALNVAYDTLLSARSRTGGRDRRLLRLVAELNQAHLISEAATAINSEGILVPPKVAAMLDEYADAIENHTRPPVIPPLPWHTPGTLLLRKGLAGLTSVLGATWTPSAAPRESKPPLRERLSKAVDRAIGPLSWIYTVRLMVSIGVATAVSEVLPLQRSYWVVLTVAIVLKPDLGSVFTRAVQSGAGAIIGAVLGAVIIAAVPYGLLLLAPFGILAALLPYGRSRSFFLLTVFYTPLIVLLTDLLAPAGWRLAEDRLFDTVLGCAIALAVGYAPWPMSWQADLPRHFAEAIRDVGRYMPVALISALASAVEASRPGEQGQLPTRSQLERRAYRSLSDVRTEFQRTMSEPRLVRRRAAASWPALVELEEVLDAVTATAIAIDQGAPAPLPEAVAQLTAILGRVADSVQARVPPAEVTSLPADVPLRPVTQAVGTTLRVMAGPRQPPAAAPAKTTPARS
jgi:hypothetical protein